EQRSYAYLIAADDGRILAKHDLVAYDNPVTYRVYADSSGLFMPWDGPNGTSPTPSPTALPDGFQPPFVPAQLVTLSSLTSVGVLDPWLPPGATETLGNNADAYVDLSSPDGFTPGSSDFRGTTSSPATFDYVFDTSVDANANVTQRQAAITQLFYNVNWFHDWYYAAGFTETAGNAQFSNYGRGGIEGDGLRAEAQDFGGFNNANMNTPADGARPRMQMFLWTKPLDLHLATDQIGNFTNLNTAVFGPLSFNITADIVQANPVDACTPLVGDYTGKIVFVDRGGPASCNGFAGKTERVQAAGGAAIIIANVATSVNPGIPPLMGGTPSVPITIGVVSMNFSDGNLFRAAFANQQALSGTLVRVTQLLDGDIDNQIVAHEWGHYISNRLIFNSAGLQNNMSRGLGEGWADFHAMLITVREEDTQVPTNANWQGTYALAGYATSSDPLSFYFGIRRYPYSTDTGKDPLTFKHISDVNPLPISPAPHFQGTNSEVHNTGEIWTTMLWESYAALLRDTLGNTPRLSFAEARDRMRDYIVAAYKVTPANPTLLEARDALLLVASINDPADYQLIGAAFAKRGAGVYAVAPPRGENTNTPVVESFAFGAAVDQAGATLTDDGQVVCNAADGILDDGETGTLRVTFRNVGNADTPQLTATATTSTSGITFPGGPDLVVPPIPRGGSAVATLQVAASGLAANTTISITVSTPDAGSGGSTPVTYAFAGNADEVAGQSSTDTAERSVVVWAQVPNPSILPPDSVWNKVSTSPSNHAYGCRSANTTATADLVSPLFFVPAGNTLALSFRYRHSLERDAINNLNFDAAVVEFSLDNGATWTDVFTLPGSGLPYNGVIASGNPLQGRPGFTGTSAGYPAFLTANVNLGTSFGGKAVRLRFRVASDSGVSSPGLEIDDIQISGTATPLFAGLVPQSPTCNAQPIANAGANQTVNEFGPGPTFTPTTVFLDGSASIDPDGNPLTYQWTQISGPPVTLSDPTARIP
ncbi:MAG TPA: M36 family metallopeptidase, partial [Myxococcaceae bacterium]|nr:M36 family metallopeptidase [Myxococcaceae bacterium]